MSQKPLAHFFERVSPKKRKSSKRSRSHSSKKADKARRLAGGGFRNASVTQFVLRVVFAGDGRIHTVHHPPVSVQEAYANVSKYVSSLVKTDFFVDLVQNELKGQVFLEVLFGEVRVSIPFLTFSLHPCTDAAYRDLVAAADAEDAEAEAEARAGVLRAPQRVLHAPPQRVLHARQRVLPDALAAADAAIQMDGGGGGVAAAAAVPVPAVFRPLARRRDEMLPSGFPAYMPERFEDDEV